MLYVLTYNHDEDGYHSHIVCEGPSPVNLDRLKKDFLKILDPGVSKILWADDCI